MALLLLSACTLDEVHRQTTGTLYFRAQNLNDSLEPVPGTLYSGPRLLGEFSTGYLELEMPLDSFVTLTYLPESELDWFPAQDHLWHFPPGEDVDTLAISFMAVSDELFSVVVESHNSRGEITGMPFTLDGNPWHTPTPSLIQFEAFATHTLVFGSDECPRGTATFSFDEQPEANLWLEVTDNNLYAADPDVIFVLDEVDHPFSLLDEGSAIQDYFLSAFRTESATRPSSYTFDMLCPFEPAFTFETMSTGHSAGQLFPDFTLSEVEPGLPESEQDAEAELSLHQMRGRITLVSFWFIDCQACQEEMPHFQDLLDDYGDHGFRILALDPVPDDDPEFYPDYDFHYLQDTHSPPVAQLAAVSAYPTNFIVQPDGVIRSRHGSLSREALEEIILELIDEFADGYPN
jgi:thiol-disulfide isomerase/thioredoxin